MSIYHGLHFQKPKSTYKQDDEIGVSVYFYSKGEKVKWSLPIKVKIKNWKNGLDRPVLKSDTEYQMKNLKISELKNLIHRTIQQIELDGLIPYPKLVKSKIDFSKYTKQKDTKHEYDFYLLKREYIHSLDLNTDLSYSTVKKNKSVLNQMESFIKEHYSDLYFPLEYIDEKFIEEFKHFSVIEKERSNTTIQKHLKILKSFVNWCRNRGYTQYHVPTINIPVGEKDMIFLQRNELYELYRFYDFDYVNPNHNKWTLEYLTDTRNNVVGSRGGEKNKTYTNYEVIKDLLVFGSCVGCRFGDLVNIKVRDIKFPNDKDGTKFLKFTMKKTRKVVRVPFNEITESIGKKYGSGKDSNQFLFPLTNRGGLISNQKFNKHIKVISRIVGLKRKVTQREYIGREVKYGTDELQPLHSVISSHIMRRTFIREGVNSNLPFHVIKSMSGHTSDKVFQGYFQTLDEEKEEGMSKMFQFHVNEMETVDKRLPTTKNTGSNISSGLKIKLSQLKSLFEEGLITKEIYEIKVRELI